MQLRAFSSRSGDGNEDTHVQLRLESSSTILRSAILRKMPGLLVLTRHGQSEWNKLNLCKYQLTMCLGDAACIDGMTEMYRDS